MILAYLRERFRLGFFTVVALAIAAAAQGFGVEGGRFALAVAGALFLLAQFRIWDDIADRRKDATAHAGRVLVKAKSPAPLIGFGMGLLAVNVGLATQRDATFLSLVLLALLHAALGGYYLFRRGRTIAGDQLVLAKYPVFVCILAGERLVSDPVPVCLAAAVIYAAASAYEAWHDPVSPLALYLGDRS